LKRFAFDLEKFLELRRYQEREAEIELARAVGALVEIERRIKALAKELVCAQREEFAPGRDIKEIQSYERYIVRLVITRDELLEEAAQAEMEVEKARSVYAEAARNRKVVDKLKEKRLRVYKKEAAATQVKFLDDISSGLAARKRVRGLES
jgi:flagellar FliJ protein